MQVEDMVSQGECNIHLKRVKMFGNKTEVLMRLSTQITHVGIMTTSL